MTHVIMLQGPYLGHLLNVAATFATAGIADGWAKPASGPYPWASSPYGQKIVPAASYDAWVASGRPANDSDVVTGAVVSISKTNPALLKLGTTDFAKFASGNRVVITGTGNALVDGKTFTLANPNGTNKTFELVGLNLVALPADLGAAGSAIKVV